MITTWPFNIAKTVVREGLGKVRPGDFSRCRAVLKQTDVTPVSDVGLGEYVCDRESEIQVGAASSYLCAGIDLSLQTMCVGEVSSFRIYRQRDCITDSLSGKCQPLNQSDSKSIPEGSSIREGDGNGKDCSDSDNPVIPAPVDVHLGTCQVSPDSRVESTSDSTLQCDITGDKSDLEEHESDRNKCSDISAKNLASSENSDIPNAADSTVVAESCRDENSDSVIEGGQQTEVESSLTLVATIEITLLSFDTSADVHHMLSENLLERSLLLKESGVQRFKTGDLVMAFYKFSRSLKYLLCIDLDKTSDKQKVTLLMSHCYANMAACQLQAGHHASAKENSMSCLTLDPQNVKALFRRAQACVKLGDYDSAIIDLQKGLELEPNNKPMLKCLSEAKEQLKMKETKLSNALSKMFK